MHVGTSTLFTALFLTKKRCDKERGEDNGDHKMHAPYINALLYH